MPFGPGNPYGNKPGRGRPRVRDSLADAVRREYPPDKIIALVREELTCEDHKTRCWAKQFLADRGYGKPTEHVEIKNDLTPDEIREELDILAREFVQSLPIEERVKLLEDPAPADTIQ